MSSNALFPRDPGRFTASGDPGLDPPSETEYDGSASEAESVAEYDPASDLKSEVEHGSAAAATPEHPSLPLAGGPSGTESQSQVRMPQAITVDSSSLSQDAREKSLAENVDAKPKGLEFKELFRITDASGKVTYHVVYSNGHVVKCGLANIYDYVAPEKVHEIEHSWFRKGLNMETVYTSEEDMGAWLKGTSPAIVNAMKKRIRELRQGSGYVAESSESSEHDVVVPARRNRGKGKGKQTDVVMSSESSEHDVIVPARRNRGKGKEKAALVRDYSHGEVKDSQDMEDEGDLSPPLLLPAEESQSSYHPERDSEAPSPPPPTFRKARPIVVVKGKAPTKTSHTPTATKASSSSAAPVVAIKTPGAAASPSSSSPKTQRRLDEYFGKKQAAPIAQAQTAASNPSKGKMRASVAISPGQDTDDSAAVQLKAEGSPKAGQKRRRSVKSYRLTTDDEDEVASSPSLSSKPLPKTPHSSASTRSTSETSARKGSRSSTKKRRTSAKPVSPPSTAEYEVERIVDHVEEDGVKKYLVKWAGYPSSANTWEPKENLASSSAAIREYEATLVDL